MAHEKDSYDEMDKIPDFAMQPAREDIDTFDPTIYEKLFSELAPLEQEEAEMIPMGTRELLADSEKKLTEESDNKMEAEPNTVSTEESTEEAELEVVAPISERDTEAKEVGTASEAAEVGAESETAEMETDGFIADEDEKAKELVTAPVAPSIPVDGEGPMEIPKAPGAEPVNGPAIPVAAPAKIIPVGAAVVSNHLKLTDIKRKPGMRILVEEDILVPDVKPDLASVLSMEASVKLSDQGISIGAQGADSVKLTGDLMLSTLYMPDRPGDEGNIVSIESRIPFKEEADVKGAAHSELAVSATVENIDFTVVNERKFKVKASVFIDLREYQPLDLELFEGLKDEEVQMLSEKIKMTDVALRKTESLELAEELPLKDVTGDIGKILCYDVNVTENHKQMTAEKAVISGTVYVNAMYLVEEEKDFDAEEGAPTVLAAPMLYQGKTEFTQFIKLDGDGPGERGMQNPVGSKVSFRITKADLTAARDEGGVANGFSLTMDLETTLEVYKDIETDIVTDVYHHMKEMRYDTREVSVMNLCGNGVAEVSTREIVNIPEKYGTIDRVVFIAGKVSDVKATLDAGKSVAEGIVNLSMICLSADEEKTPFSLKKEIPFRSAVDIPGVRADMEVDCEAQLKDLWYDKMNSRQIEVNAGVLINTTVCSRQRHPLIDNVSFVELPASTGNEPSIILYITREGDNVWRIAKKYRTTIENIKKVNGLEDGGKLKPGTKLLIVK